jgi:hypothetical protein
VSLTTGHRCRLISRVPAKVKARLGKMVDEMADAQTPSTPANTLLTIRKLRHWCDGTGAFLTSSRADPSRQARSPSPARQLSQSRSSRIGIAKTAVRRSFAVGLFAVVDVKK